MVHTDRVEPVSTARIDKHMQMIYLVRTHNQM